MIAKNSALFVVIFHIGEEFTAIWPSTLHTRLLATTVTTRPYDLKARNGFGGDSFQSIRHILIPL